MQVQSLGREDPLEEEMATHSSILVWETPWTKEPSGLQYMCAVVTQSVMSKSLQSMHCSPPGSSVYGIFQTRILEWVAISSSTGSSGPRDRTRVSCVPCIVRLILHR